MATLNDVSRHVRSKNAGPFWVTVDIFFDSRESFSKYATSEKLAPQAFAELYGANPEQVQHHLVPDLNILKISYPRTWPQGGELERDMHAGNQCKRLLGIELD